MGAQTRVKVSRTRLLERLQAQREKIVSAHAKAVEALAIIGTALERWDG